VAQPSHSHITPAVKPELAAATPVDGGELRLSPVSRGARASGLQAFFARGDYDVRRKARHVTTQAILGLMAWPQLSPIVIHHSSLSSQVIGGASLAGCCIPGKRA